MKGEGLRPARKRRLAEINIVPLIDVLVVLIFFLLIAMQFRNLTILQLVLPKMESAGKSQQQEYVEISVTKEGALYFNGEAIERDELEARLTEVAELDSGTPVLISADEASLLKDTTTVMDLCRRLGLEAVRLQAR